MGHRISNLSILLSAMALTACMSESKPDSTTPNDADVTDPYRFSSLCENHFDALRGKVATSPTVLSLKIEQAASGEVTLTNGDFEDSNSATAGTSYNEDPMYVYSGQRSAAITDGDFRARIDEDDHYSTRNLKALSLWLYSASEEAVEFEVNTYGIMLDRVSGAEGQGYSGHSQGAQNVVTVEPHKWVPVSLDLQTPYLTECVGELSVTRLSSGNGTYYVDAIELAAEKK